jgi:uncharacterized membrane protein|uniref:DUF2177 family protein n=1 Tax=viral metagenome TaxID=1070528 RepID=A0A6C0INI7_9ZZZZ
MIIIITSAIVLLIIDFIYLSSVGRYFSNQIETIQKTPFELESISTVLTYVVIIFALYYFILKENKSVIDAFLLGFAIYMIFELTNKALFDKWSWKTVFIDGIWGGILFALTTFLTYQIYSLFR